MKKPAAKRKKPVFQPRPKTEKEEPDQNGPRYNRIKAVMAEKNVSNIELANLLGVTAGTVSNWCRNFKQPKLETLYEIAKALGEQPATLLNTIERAGA